MKDLIISSVIIVFSLLLLSFDSIEPVIIKNEIKVEIPEKEYMLFKPLVEQFEVLKYYITALVFLLVADFVTGTRKAKSLKLPITSTGFRRSISKFIEYSIAIISSHVFTWLFKLDITLSYYVAIYICGTELYSIWENVSQTTGTNIKDYILGFFPSIKDFMKKKKPAEDSTGDDSETDQK